MKVSDVIKQLEDLKKDLGDLEVTCITEIEVGFVVEFGKVFERIGIPMDDGSTIEVIGFVPPKLLEDDEETEPPKKENHLTLIK